MKSIKIVNGALALIFCTSVASAEVRKPRIAEMRSPDKRTAGEYKYSLEKLGWTTDVYPCTVDAHQQLADKLGQYDFVMSTSLFNWKTPLPKGSVDKAKFLKYMNDGGVLVIVDAAYEETRSWIAELGSDFGGIKNGACNSSDWQVFGATYDETPPHPIRFFPNKITCGNNWPHFLKPEKGSKWRTLAYCSEGFPVTFVQDVGKGMMVVSALTHPTAEQLQNYYANALLRQNDLKLKSFSITPLQVGAGKIAMELEAPLKDKAKLVYEIVDAQNKAERFEADVVGTTCELDFEIAKRGAISGTLMLSIGKNDIGIFRRDAVLPQLITLHPNAYRGILSTKRRLPEVKFKVDIAVIDEDLKNARLAISVFDPCGNKVSGLEHDFSTNAIPSEVVLSVPMDGSLTAGAYAVRAELLKPRAKFNGMKSEVAIQIFDPRPAQAIVDEDRTILVNGVPFFPVGTYHVKPDDFPKMKEIGFNTVQFWQWDNWPDKHGVRTALSKAQANGLKLIVEGVNNDNIAKERELTGEYPCVLAWYAFDELSERGFDGAGKRVELLREDDQHLVYGLSCRPDLFAATAPMTDVFAYNAGTNEEAYEIVGLGARKPTIYVPGSFADMIPDPESMRHVAYRALVHDVRGILWYCWSQIGGGPIGRGMHDSPPHQEVVKRVCAEIKIMEPGLLSTYRRPFKAADAVDGYVCGTEKGKRFLLMVNRTDKPVDVEIVVDELAKAGMVRNPFVEDKAFDIEIKGGVVAKQFAAKEILVYNW